jgi:hypothetical protein
MFAKSSRSATRLEAHLKLLELRTTRFPFRPLVAFGRRASAELGGLRQHRDSALLVTCGVEYEIADCRFPSWKWSCCFWKFEAPQSCFPLSRLVLCTTRMFVPGPTFLELEVYRGAFHLVLADSRDLKSAAIGNNGGVVVCIKHWKCRSYSAFSRLALPLVKGSDSLL